MFFFFAEIETVMPTEAYVPFHCRFAVRTLTTKTTLTSTCWRQNYDVCSQYAEHINACDLYSTRFWIVP